MIKVYENVGRQQVKDFTKAEGLFIRHSNYV